MSPPVATWAQDIGQHREALLQFARRLLRSRPGIDASDVVHVTLSQAMETPESPANPAGWLRHVLRNRVIDACRQQDRWAIDNLPLHLPGTGTSPSGDAVRGENCQRVHAALAQLLPAERDVIELSYFLNLTWTQKEIADHLGVSRGRVVGLLTRAQAKLRKLLDDLE
ncbi:hypothetical protein AYO44_05925 [Planctomycetaceae bacterium SCGC AG-212-F19]|nr:hypothetical protein AYO44_05925 [Planctomycetaceae bacterium SCGC AG-212-F19]